MKTFFFYLESTCACVLGPWPWPRAFLSLASRVSVLGKAVLGLSLGFFLCPWPWPRALCRRLHLCYLHYFLANCDRKNPISDLVRYLTTTCKQAMLRNCSRRLRPVATFRELSMTSNFGCFASLRVASRPV